MNDFNGYAVVDAVVLFLARTHKRFMRMPVTTASLAVDDTNDECADAATAMDFGPLTAWLVLCDDDDTGVQALRVSLC